MTRAATENFNKTLPETYTGYHLANAAALLSLWAFTLLAYSHLPEQIPGHIGPGGVTRWERRESGMWFLLPMIGTMHVLLLYALAHAAGTATSGFNVPQKKRLQALPPEGQRFALRPMRGFMYGMVTWLLVLMLAMQIMSYQTARAGGLTRTDSLTLLAAVIAFTAVPVIMALRLGRSVGRRIDEWEASQD